MGIFSKWRVFSKPEALLEERLRQNPFYPFHLLGGGTAEPAARTLGSGSTTSESPVYVYARRLKRFYGALLVGVASLLFIIIWPAAGGEGEYLGFGFSALFLSGYVCLEYYSVRRLILDPDMHQYSVYKGSRLIATQHCHNIYVRLLTKTSGSQQVSYLLVMDGVGLEEPIQLTKATENKKKLRHLAHTITSNLQLNYFDIHDKSKHHIIRHNRPRLTTINDVEDHEE